MELNGTGNHTACATNQRAAGKGESACLFHVNHPRLALPERGRWAATSVKLPSL
jgi:hypothetical protein